MKRITTHIYKFLYLLLWILLFSGCNNTDDAAAIFTGKVWELTFITEDGKRWYPFHDITDPQAYEAYDLHNGNKRFTMNFAGIQTDDVITGDFKGNGSAEITGTWTANAKSNQFTANIKANNVMDGNDKIVAKIIDGLKKATSYKGNDDNLFIYYPYNEKVNLRLVFHVKRD